jgi:predicted TPR repeat methyltransferase
MRAYLSVLAHRAASLSSTSATAAPADYRSQHLDPAHAEYYDEGFWSPGTAKHLNWDLERRLLDLVIDRHLHAPIDLALDVACGTGRVLQYLETKAARTVGIDISSAMLGIAQARCSRSRLLRRDVTAQPEPELRHRADLVTAFRFLLNAEPDLRLGALRSADSMLAPAGILVANVHLNPRSARGIYLRARWRGRQRSPMLAPSQATALLAEAGFELLALYGYEYLPYRRDGSRLAAVNLRRRLENSLLDRPRVARVGGAFLLVARPR